MPSVLWLRRDLRLGDHPASLAAADDGSDGVVALFVLDPMLLNAAGSPRRDYLFDTLRVLDGQLDGRLVVRTGDPAVVVPQIAADVDASGVHVSADYGPYGSRRDADVEAALHGSGRQLVRTGSPYAVSPGRVLNGSGNPYRVFSAYFRSWADHGWREPAASGGATAEWLDLKSEDIPAGSGFRSAVLPEPGEAAALARLDEVMDRGGYAATRDVPGVDGTTLLSAALRWGCLHPRTVLARLGADDDVLRKELAWREFYADVLHAKPDSARQSMTLTAMRWDIDTAAKAKFERWRTGTTGYPIVDAGMRQLAAEGWMHNRVRMVVASFLVKDLHLPWQWGARQFMDSLVDGDLASNSHGWQWAAGTGTDAAPFFRIFNPTAQGKRFDPDGTYVRRHVPELAAVADRWVHEPWLDPSNHFPAPMVDHVAERLEALARLGECRGTPDA